MAPQLFTAWHGKSPGNTELIMTLSKNIQRKEYLTDVIVCGLSYCSCEVTASLSLPRQFPFFRQRKCQGPKEGVIRLTDITHSSSNLCSFHLSHIFRCARVPVLPQSNTLNMGRFLHIVPSLFEIDTKAHECD